MTNNIKNNLYSNFKPFSAYKNTEKQNKINTKALIGAAAGTCLALTYTNKKYGTKNTKNSFKEASRMITMALGANIGGVLGGSIGADKNAVKRKIKEGAFQMMNMALPMTLVSSYMELCKNVKIMNNNPTKIIGSFVSMISGAFLATQITNSIKGVGEVKRKYTIKDSVANFDDIIATIKIGFDKIDEIIPISKILPFIYAYTGTRAGSKK